MGPMFAIVGYLFFGVCIATFGPLEYKGYEAVSVFAFMLFVAIFFIVGFTLGSRTKAPAHAIWKKKQNPAVLAFVFRVSLFTSSLLMTYELLSAALSGGLHFSLASSAYAYINSYTDYVRNSGNYSLNFIITSLGAFPLFIAQVLGIFYYRTLDRPSRIALIYLFVVTVLVDTLGGGKQKQFGDIIIYVVSVVLAKRAATGSLSLAKLVKVGFFVLAGMYVMLALLAFRYQAIGVNLSDLNNHLHPLIHYNKGYWMENVLGGALAFPLVMFSGYLGQGYFGLSLSLEQPFIWTHFAGSSYSVSVIVNRLFGAEFWVKESYPYRVGSATGWDESKWHTVFSWLASDLTFPGVVVFMGVVGFIYGRAWREILLFQNPFSVMIFAMMNIGWAYAPANNQLMHSPGALTTTLGTLLIYFLFHANFNAAPTNLKALNFRPRR